MYNFNKTYLKNDILEVMPSIPIVTDDIVTRLKKKRYDVKRISVRNTLLRLKKAGKVSQVKENLWRRDSAL